MKNSIKKRPEHQSDTNTDYSKQQSEIVRKILECKDYYTILGVTKTATDLELKEAYKHRALQIHPDKNRAPGATEAFKAVGNAVAVLRDVHKRWQYDLLCGSNLKEDGPYKKENNHFNHNAYHHPSYKNGNNNFNHHEHHQSEADANTRGFKSIVLSSLAFGVILFIIIKMMRRSSMRPPVFTPPFYNEPQISFSKLAIGVAPLLVYLRRRLLKKR